MQGQLFPAGLIVDLASAAAGVRISCRVRLETPQTLCFLKTGGFQNQTTWCNAGCALLAWPRRRFFQSFSEWLLTEGKQGFESSLPILLQDCGESFPLVRGSPHFEPILWQGNLQTPSNSLHDLNNSIIRRKNVFFFRFLCCVVCPYNISSFHPTTLIRKVNF